MEGIRKDFKTFNDTVMPAIVEVINSKLSEKPCKYNSKKIIEFEKRLKALEDEVRLFIDNNNKQQL
jgi:hypothetical protein